MLGRKNTKRALINSVIALAICFALFAGTTLAWFTDSVSSVNNRIVAGNLKVDLVMDKELTGDYVSVANGNGSIFREGEIAQNSSETLWEPGKTQIVYLGVRNVGSLAVKYNVIVDVTDNGLASALEYAIVDGATAADLANVTSWAQLTASAAPAPVQPGRQVAAPNGRLDVGETDYFALAVHMKEDAGNEYQDKNVIIDVAVTATQAAVEEDSFDNLYDADAPLPAAGRVFIVSTAQEFADALEFANTSGEETTIVVSDNVPDACLNGLTGIKTFAGTDLTVDFGGTCTRVVYPVGSTGTVTNGTQFLKGSRVTLKNGTYEADGTDIRILVQNYCDLRLEDVILDGDLPDVEYVLSCNYGTTVVTGNTCIYAAPGATAVDVMDWTVSAYNDAGTTVIFDENFTGEVHGRIEVYQYPANSNPDTEATLIIKGGSFYDTGLTFAEFSAFVPEGCTALELGFGDYIVFYA